MDVDRIDSVLSLLKYGGILVGGLSGALGILTRTHTEPKRGQKRKFTVWGWTSLILTIAGFGVGAGAQFAEDSRQRIQKVESKKDAKEQREENARILAELTEQKKINARAEQEFREKFQKVLIQLNAAKQEDSKRITEEKIRVIQKDFSDWADNFVKNQERIRSEVDKAKSDFEQGKLQAQIDEVKKEVQLSQQAFPVISFSVRYVQEAVRAYSKKTGKEIEVKPLELPENVYDGQTDYEIRFNTNAVWKFSISANRPAAQIQSPRYYPGLRIDFTDVHGKSSGSLQLQIRLAQNKFSMIYQAVVPTPDPKGISGLRDLTDYETPIQEVFQRVIEAQLVQTFE